MAGLATLEDSNALYDAALVARGDIGSYSGGNAPRPYLVAAPTLSPPYDLSKLSEHERMWQDNLARREALENLRLAPPQIRLWDGDYTLRGELEGWRSIDFEFIENDTGTATVKLSLNHYLAKWVMDFRGRSKRNVHITIDKQGTRWSGFMDHYKIAKTDNGDRYLEVVFMNDYEQAKHIFCWANPFLRPELQFPKLWTIFGPAKWCLLVTLFVNIMRLESSLWTLPDNPLDINEWMDFNVSTWRNITKPFALATDMSGDTIVFSRFKSWHDVAKDILTSNELTVTCRRYLINCDNPDPHPFSDLEGLLDDSIAESIFELVPLRHGCLVWDIVDNSGWGPLGTSFGGSLLTGLIRSVVNIADDGYTESVDIYTGDYTAPDQYYNPAFLGTAPAYPWVVFEDSPYTGIKSSEFTYYEATTTSFLTGGHSMPGVNEAISAAINMGGDFLTSLINTWIGMAASVSAGGGFGGDVSVSVPPIDIPPLGGVMDAVAKILYEDTFLAFMEIPTLRAAPGGSLLPLVGLDSNLTSVGDFHLYEDWCDGADRAFTLSAAMAVLAKIWATRPRTAHTIKVSDASPYLIGENGYGHFWLGNRVATGLVDFPDPFVLFAERVSKIRYHWDEKGPKGWELDVGHQEPVEPAFKALQEVKKVNGALSTWGIL